MKLASLIFQSKTLEDEYCKLKSSDKNSITQFAIVFILYLLVLLLRETIGMAIYHDFATTWGVFIYLGALISLFLAVFAAYSKLSKKFPQLKNQRDFIIFIFAVLIIIYYHAVLPHVEPEDYRVPFWVAFNQQFFVAIMLFILNRWTFKVLLVIFSTVLAFGVNYTQKDNKYIVEIIFFVVVISYFIRQKEKIERFAFKENFRTSQYKKSWGNLIHNLPEGVLLVDKDKKVVYRNPAFSRIVGSLNVETQDTEDFSSWEYLKGFTNLKYRDSFHRSKESRNNKSFYKFNSSKSSIKVSNEGEQSQIMLQRKVSENDQFSRVILLLVRQ